MWMNLTNIKTCKRSLWIKNSLEVLPLLPLEGEVHFPASSSGQCSRDYLRTMGCCFKDVAYFTAFALLTMLLPESQRPRQEVQVPGDNRAVGVPQAAPCTEQLQRGPRGQTCDPPAWPSHRMCADGERPQLT